VSTAVRGSSGDATAAINAALASGDPHVYFPAGTYVVAGAVAGSAAHQRVSFAPGATLDVQPTGSVRFAGEAQRIEGLSVALTMTTSEAVRAVDVAGARSVVDGARLTTTQDAANATLLRISGSSVEARNIQVTAAGSFRYGVELAVDDVGDHAREPIVRGVHYTLTAPSARTYGALLRMRTRGATVSDFTFTGNGDALFPDGLIRNAGQRNTLRDPRILQASGAKYAIYSEDEAEFLTILGGQIVGRTNGTYYVDSEAIYCGHAAGHLKIRDTAINGWDYHIGIHGTHDTPIIDGGVLAQSRTASILIDAVVPSGPFAGSWPVSAMTIQGMYFEYGAPGAGGRVIWCKSGALEGLSIASSLWGYDDAAIYVEDDFEELSGVEFLGGNRMIATAPTDALIRPNATTGDVNVAAGNQLNISSLVSKGPHAVNVSRAPQVFRSTATANFGNALTAGASHELAFSVAGAAAGDSVTATLAANVATLEGLQCIAWVHQAGQVRIRATNNSETNHTAVSGTVVLELTKG
jgi:hypothetical protein